MARLLENSYVVNNNGFGALVRLLPSYPGTSEPLHIKPGIEMALERMILGCNQKGYDYATSGMNVLKNLVSLIKYAKNCELVIDVNDRDNKFFRLEKLNTSSHLTQSLVTTTTTDCISKILVIQSLLLKRNFRAMRNHSMDDDSQCNDEDNIEYKSQRIKIENNGTDDARDVATDDANQTQMEKEQIHLIVNLLDLLEVGGTDCVLGMVDIIKLAQLTVSYFFWSLYEKSKLRRFITKSKNEIFIF